MLNELIELSIGFQSSVNISYDLKNDEKIQSFIPTTSSLELISNILMSVSPESTQRAKILTGAYGRGKSHIILVALSMLYRGGKKKIFTNLLNRMKAYDEDLYKIASNHLQSKTKLLPVIIGGSSSSLTQAFMNALQQALSSNNLEDIMPDTHFQAAENTILKWKEIYPDTYKTFTERISSKIDVFLNELKAHNAKAYREFISVYPDLTAGSTVNPFVGFDVAEIYEQVSIALKDKGFDGLFVVYDEFGKYLESSISITRDISKRHQKRNKELFDRVVRYIIENVGMTFSAPSIVKFLKSENRSLSVESVYNYIKWLSEAFIIYPCQRYDLQGKAVLKTQEKYYLSDISFRYSQMGFDRKMLSAMLENVVYLEMKRRGYDIYIGKNSAKEIDFVGVRREERIYVQVCVELPTESTRETDNLMEIKDHYHKYVVCRDPLAIGNDNGIEIVHIADFLLRENW